MFKIHINFLEKKGDKVKILILLVVALLLTLPSLWMYFYSEDLSAVRFSGRGALANIKLIFSSDIGLFQDNGGLYRPLVNFTKFIDFKLCGFSPIGYHISNVLFHLLSIVLLYIFLAQMSTKKLLPFFGTLTFIMLAVHASSIFWISGRSDLICAVFMLLAFILFNNYLSRGKVGSLILAQLSFLLALLGKEMGIVIPFVWLLLYLYRRKEHLNIMQKARIAAFSGLVILIYLVFKFQFTSVLIGSHPMSETVNLTQIPLNLIKFGIFLFVPYGHSHIEQAVLHKEILLLGTVALYLTLWAGYIVCVFIKERDRWRENIISLALFCILLMPVILLPHRWYLYIPSLVLCWFLGRRLLFGTKLERILITVFLFLNLVGYMVAANIWLENGRLNERMLTGAKELVEDHPDKEIILLNFPAKVHRFATFVPGFENSIRAMLGSDEHTVARLFLVSYPYDYYEPEIDISDDSIIFDYSAGDASILTTRDRTNIDTPIELPSMKAFELIVKRDDVTDRINIIKIANLDKLNDKNSCVYYFTASGWNRIIF